MWRTWARRILVVLTICIWCGGSAWAAEWYVSATGSPVGDGSIGNPWDLQTALNDSGASAAIAPGDTIWLRGGTYSGLYTSHLNGTSSDPIIVRSYAGEWAVLKAPQINTRPATLSILGGYTWYWDFEITTAGNDRISTQSTPWPDDINYAGGVDTGNHPGEGTGCKLINLVVHNTCQALSLWVEALNLQTTGCVIWHNGWDAPDRGHGHGMYVQNNTGTKIASDNIVFGGFSYGTQCYGSDTAYVKNITYQYNTYFDCGDNSAVEGGANLLIGGASNGQNLAAVGNMIYRRNADMSSGFRLGYGGPNYDGVIQGNYFACGLQIYRWASLTFRNNTCVGPRRLTNPLNTTGVGAVPPYDWNFNTYYCSQTPDPWSAGQPFLREMAGTGGFSSQHFYPEWRTITGYDANSSYTSAYPATAAIFVRRNPEDAQRGNITVFNWPQSATVNVDISSVVGPNQPYHILDAQNYFAAPVASGVYGGGTIALPMADGNAPAAQPTGNAPLPYTHTPRQFGAFVLIARASVNGAPTVYAGTDTMEILSGSSVTTALDGTVSDDGLPAGSSLTQTWSMASGPTAVVFANASAVDTTATFVTPGTYVLRLTASDTDRTSYDEVSIRVRDADDILMMHLPMNEMTGFVAGDATGHGHDGALYNGPAWVAGKLGGAVQFDEVDDHIRVSDFYYGTEFSVSFWFKVSDNAGSQYQYVVSHGPAAELHSLSIYLAEQGEGSAVAGKFRTLFRDADDEGDNFMTDFVAPVDGIWHLYTLTVGPGPGTRIYLDANQVAIDPARGGGACDPNGDIYLGGRRDLSAGRFYGGALDDVRIYEIALTPAQVAALMGGNAAPAVSAGANQSITLPASASLDGTVSDDGQPDPPAACTTTWAMVSGPAAVLFGNVAAVDTTATFLTSGTYVLRLTASDSALSASDDVQIIVNKDLRADFNNDAFVDGLDFLRWQANFNQWPGGGATKFDGDANGDGIVDGLDFLIWQVGFNR